MTAFKCIFLTYERFKFYGCSCSYSWTRQAVAATEEGRGKCSAPHPPHHLSLPSDTSTWILQGVPASSKPLCNRSGLLTWLKDAFFFFSKQGMESSGSGQDEAEPRRKHLSLSNCGAQFHPWTAVLEDLAETVAPSQPEFQLLVEPTLTAYAKPRPGSVAWCDNTHSHSTTRTTSIFPALDKVQRPGPALLQCMCPRPGRLPKAQDASSFSHMAPLPVRSIRLCCKMVLVRRGQGCPVLDTAVPPRPHSMAQPGLSWWCLCGNGLRKSRTPHKCEEWGKKWETDLWEPSQKGLRSSRCLSRYSPAAHGGTMVKQVFPGSPQPGLLLPEVNPLVSEWGTRPEQSSPPEGRPSSWGHP